MDLSEGKIYWVEKVNNEATFDTGLIRRSNLDGSSVETVIATDYASEGFSSAPEDIAVDPESGLIYWTDSTDFGHEGGIYRANIDGSNPQLIVQDFKPSSIELDLYNDRIYWTDSVDNEILSAEFDGSGFERVLSTSARPFGLAIDPLAGHIYFSNVTTGASPSSELTRVNYDGSDPVVLSTINEDVRDLEVDPGAGKIFWANLGEKLIQCSGMNGDSIQIVYDSGLTYPSSVALGISSTLTEVSSEITIRPMLQFSTEEGTLYNILASDTPGGAYTLIGRVVGNGSVLFFTDPEEMATKRFYKVVAN